jgi:hypothetical protein
MRRRYLLALARWALVSLLALLGSGRVKATFYNLCNKGTVEARYATAVRQGSFLFGYSWDLDGWYVIPPGECDDAYHHSNNARDEPIYVAIAFTDSTGVWGAAMFQGVDTFAPAGKVAVIDNTTLCLKNDIFKYHLNGNLSLPCKTGYFPFPAALYLEPLDRGCADEIGSLCFAETYNFDFELNANSRAIAVNKGSGSAPASSNSASPSSASSGPSMGTALGVLGALVAGAAIVADAPPKPFEPGTLNASLIWKKIVRRSAGNPKWYYADGSRVNPVYQLDGQTNSYLFDAPEQRPVTEPEVVAAQQALRRALAMWSGSRHTEVFSQGRFIYSYAKNQQEVHKDLTTLGTLDFTKARRYNKGNGLACFEIPCRGGQACVIGLDEDSAGNLSNNHIYSSLYLYFQGDENADSVWNALLRLHELYPAEPTVVAR